MVRRLIAGVWCIVIVILAATTFFTADDPYGTLWFAVMWGMAGVMLAAVMVAVRMWHRLPSLIIHTALLLILIGGGLTAFRGERGSMTLIPGSEPTRAWMTPDGTLRRLPEPIALDSFVIARHPGTEFPSGFTSHLTIGGREAILTVNHPLTIGSYRLYQASYDPSGASVITVNHDPARGMAVSYGAYILLGIGFILCMVNPRGRFRRLLRGLGMAAMLLTCAGASAAPRGISAGEAAKIDTMQVLYQGRAAPFSTPATHLLRAMTGSTTFRGLRAERIAASIMMYPQDWSSVELLLVESDTLRRALGMTGHFIAPAELYDHEGNYRLASMFGGTDSGPDRDIAELDGRLAAFREAAEGRLCSPLPDSMPRLSAARVAVERCYVSVPAGKITFMALLTVGFAALAASRLRRKWPGALIGASMAAALSWQFAAMAVKWLIMKQAPMVSGPDALALAALLLTGCALSLWLTRRRLTGALVCVIAGFAALVSWLGTPVNPFSPSMPVLSSPWLAVHVSLVMSAYALLAVTFAVALTMLFRPSDSSARLILVILYPATALLAAGIFTGAVWAGEAWGRYWAWDPKETWALITMMVYVIPLHVRLSPRRLAIFTLAAFLTVIMTYAGVNYLPSLHAYQ